MIGRTPRADRRRQSVGPACRFRPCTDKTRSETCGRSIRTPPPGGNSPTGSASPSRSNGPCTSAKPDAAPPARSTSPAPPWTTAPSTTSPMITAARLAATPLPGSTAAPASWPRRARPLHAWRSSPSCTRPATTPCTGPNSGTRRGDAPWAWTMTPSRPVRQPGDAKPDAATGAPSPNPSGEVERAGSRGARRACEDDRPADLALRSPTSPPGGRFFAPTPGRPRLPGKTRASPAPQAASPPRRETPTPDQADCRHAASRWSCMPCRSFPDSLNRETPVPPPRSCAEPGPGSYRFHQPEPKR